MYLLWYLCCFATFSVGILLVWVIATNHKHTPCPILEFAERCYGDGKGNLYVFPHTDNPELGPSLDLTVIVPALNEEARIEKTLFEISDYLKRRPNFTYEIIVANSNSSDKTAEVSLSVVVKETCDKIRVLNLCKNCGKGGAVQKGVFVSRGNTILITDADGATPILELEKLEQKLAQIATKQGDAVVVGSRVLSKACAKRPLLRRWLGLVYYKLVTLLLGLGIKDTQCGFKLFTRQSAIRIFNKVHLLGFSFDIEVLYLAKRLNIPVHEIGVEWHEKKGGHVDKKLFATISEMFIGLIRVWLNYTLGLWT